MSDHVTAGKKMQAFFEANAPRDADAVAPQQGHDSTADSSPAPAAPTASPAEDQGVTPAEPQESPQELGPKAKDRFHDMAAQIKDLRAQLEERDRRHQSELQRAKEQAGLDAVLKALSDTPRPDGYEDWSDDQQRQWIAAKAAEHVVDVKLPRDGLEYVKDLALADKAEDMLPGLTRAQRKAVASVAKELQDVISAGRAGWQEALAISKIRNPDLFQEAQPAPQEDSTPPAPGMVFQGQRPGQTARQRPSDVSRNEEISAIRKEMAEGFNVDRHALSGRMMQILFGGG